MAIKAEGSWPCTVLGATYGEDDKHNLVVRINVKIDDGPSKGMTCTYEDKVDNRSSIYVARSCKAVGWKAQRLATLRDDVAAWIEETGGKSTVDIKHLELKRGKKYDEWVDGGCVGPTPIWDKVSAIGRGPKPLVEPTSSTLADAEEAMRNALAEDGGSAPPDDADPNDIPFISCSATASLGEIAKVLR